MFGFFQEVKEKPRRERVPSKARLEDIPVVTLREQSCKVCPRNDDLSGIHTPKMPPEGPDDAPIYLLGDSPSQEDDEADVHWTDKAMADIYLKFGQSFMREEVRSNYTVQCRGEAHVVATECCRGRIERDIEETRPLVVVTVGDAALRWATGMDGKASAPQFRGLLFVAKFGKHVCYVYPIVYPNYVHKRRGRKSQFELCVEHDVRWIKDNFDRLPEPRYYSAPYDSGIEIITGEQPGDMQRLERKLSQVARDYPRHALDLECTGLRPYMQRHPAILSAAVGTLEDTVAFPLKMTSAGTDGGWGTDAREHQAMRIFGEYLQGSGRKCAHNLAMEQEWIGHEFGYEILRRTEWDDTMAMAYALENRAGTQSLGKQTLRFFGFDVKAQSPINVKQERWWTLYRAGDILRYNGMDTKWTDGVRRAREPQLAADAAARGVYEQRIRLAPALIRMESRGLEVDFDFVRKLDGEMRDQLRETEKHLLRCAEILDYERKFGRFEPTNTDHVLRLMRDFLRRPEVEREDQDGVSFTTDEEALAAMPRSEVPSAPLILEHREVSKLHGTYVLPALQKKWVCRDNRIRSKYGSLFVGTGRLQSEDPNAQNFPKRKHKRVRGMVRAGKGRWLVPCDYGQIEFRVVGMASGDKNLVKYCWTGYDVHKYWAQRMLDTYAPVQDWILDEFADGRKAGIAKAGKEFDEDAWILKTLRQEAKNKWVFPQLFGSRTESCARNLHLPEDVASDLGGEFWDEFRGVKEWQEDLAKFYDRHLYVETLNGHRRRGAMSLNELINMPIQGTAAFIVQEAQMALDELADATGDDELSPILNVHDDLTFDISDETLEQKIEVIAREMCLPRFDWINVPLVVEVSAGSRWDNAEELRVYRSHELFGTPNPYAEAA